MSDHLAVSPGLKIEEHALVMRELLDKPLHVIRRLGTDAEVREEEVLAAALQVQAFGPETQARLQRMRSMYPDLLIGIRLTGPEFFEPIRELEEEIDGKTTSEAVSIITQRGAEENGNVALASLLDLTSRLLADGASSVYGPDPATAELLESSGGAPRIFYAAAGGALTGGAAAFTRADESQEAIESGVVTGAVGAAASEFIRALKQR